MDYPPLLVEHGLFWHECFEDTPDGSKIWINGLFEYRCTMEVDAVEYLLAGIGIGRIQKRLEALCEEVIGKKFVEGIPMWDYDITEEALYVRKRAHMLEIKLRW